jgi:hypothetical protein
MFVSSRNGVAEDVGLVGCYAVSVGKWLSVFRRAVVPCLTLSLFII